MAIVTPFARPRVKNYDAGLRVSSCEVAMSPAVDTDEQSIGIESSESLEHLQRRLIAEMLNLKFEDVTDDFIDTYLEEHVYPHGRFNINSEYGGYDNSHLAVRTRDEFEQMKKSVAAARQQLKRDVTDLRR